MIERKNEDYDNTYTFKIMGDEYIVRGKDDAEYMEEVARYIEQTIQSISENNPRLNKSQISILAALRVADELHKLRKNYQYLEELLEQAK
jgi:cell division protein ZapA